MNTHENEQLQAQEQENQREEENQSFTVSYDPNNSVTPELMSQIQKELSETMQEAHESESIDDVVSATAKAQSIIYPIKIRADLLSTAKKQMQDNINLIEQEQRLIRNIGLHEAMVDPTEALVSKIGHMVLSSTDAGKELSALLEAFSNG